MTFLSNTIFLLLFWFCKHIQGVPVALLQEDGFYSGKSHLLYKGGLPVNVNDFTLCARLSLNYLRGSKNHWLSVGNETHGELLIGTLIDDEESQRISLERFHPSIKDEISLKFKKGFDFNVWHHFCFVFSSFPEVPYPGGNMNLTNKIYMDGDFIREVTYVVPKSTFVQLTRGSKLILGQKQDPFKLDFDPEESFSGRYSQVMIWRGELVLEEIKRLASCKNVSNRGNIIDWNLNYYDGAEVDVRNLDVDEVCQESKLTGVALFGQGGQFHEHKFICDKLEGQFPVFDSQQDKIVQYFDAKDLFEQHVGNISCQLAEDIFFWTGLVKDPRKDEPVFLDLYAQEPISWQPDLWPGPSAQNIACTMVRGAQYLAREKCESKLPCGICYFNPKKRLYLKGLCFKELKEKNEFDTEYYVHGVVNGYLHFRGTKSSHIFYDHLNETWVLQSLRSPEKKSILNFDPNSGEAFTFPIGRFEWIVNNTRDDIMGICSLKNGEPHTLTFSDCHPDRFTCSDGSCISLDAKCNSIVDCTDGSDESDCQYLLLDQDYPKDKLPLKDRNEPVEVFFGIEVNAFPQIDPSSYKMKSDYDLNLRWYDPRLKFRDLSNTSDLNDLGNKEKSILWSPRLVLPNALGTVGKLVDEETNLRLKREVSEPLPEDLSLPREAKLFSGESNSISLTKHFSQDHSCNFDLYYFPFDSQVCSLEFELRDKTDDLIRFQPDSEPLKYRGARALNQYDVETEMLEIGRNHRNFSFASVKFVLRHRSEFYMITVFIQTLIVLMVALATFFFAEDDFSDRIMVNAVLILVMATINSSIQTLVPNTSYYKLLDIWLLFCVVMIVITIILHTIVAAFFGGNLIRKDSDDDEDNNFKMANYAAVGLFLAIVVIFNIVFWTMALKEYNKKALEIMEEKKFVMK